MMTSAPKLTQEDRVALREFLMARFEQSELDTIAFDLVVDDPPLAKTQDQSLRAILLGISSSVTEFMTCSGR